MQMTATLREDLISNQIRQMNPLTVSFVAKSTDNPQNTNKQIDSFLLPAVNYGNPPWKADKIVKEELGEFISALAHEIRNPLANINLSVKLLETEIKSEELKTYLDIIMRSSIRINNLIKELLIYQHSEEVPSEKHSIHELLDEVIEMTKDRIKLKNITVLKLYEAEDCSILMNRQKMKIAMTNIIINAIDAMASMNGILKLVTTCTGKKFTICIEDNGSGISRENLQYIFKPYYTSKPGGLGQGLATTYEILRSNHVGFKVESEEGSGTSFILLFDK
jgi:signal transduction histidine kinase